MKSTISEMKNDKIVLIAYWIYYKGSELIKKSLESTPSEEKKKKENAFEKGAEFQ